MGGRSGVPLAIAVVLGALLGRLAPGASGPVLAVALAFAGAAWRTPPRLGTVVLLVAVASSAAARGAAYHERLEHARAAIPPGGTFVHLRAQVCEPPTDAAAEPAVVVRIQAAEPPLPSGMRLRLRCPAGTAIEWSDRLTGLAWIDRLGAPRNPGGFDGCAFADANALLGSGRFVWCRASHASGLAAWPRATFGRWRTALERRLATRLRPTTRDVVWPLVLGDRSDMPLGLGAELRVSGLMHLIALSGLHVTWLAELVRTFAVALGAGMRARALAGAGCALFYIGLAGPIPSLARAAMSEALASGAALASRRLDPLHALALSATALLVVFPGWIDDLGFQLSCTATLGLATIGTAFADVRGPLGRGVRATSSTLGAQIVSLPLVLHAFHLLPWVAPLANLLAVPVASWLLSAAWFAMMADVLLPGLGTWWFRACDLLAAMLEVILGQAASIPGAALAAGHDARVAGLAAVGALLLVGACARRLPPAAEPARRPIALGAAIVGAAACVSAVMLTAWQSEIRPPPGRVWCVVLDVGQGDAIALGFPDGWWLVDAGARAPHSDAGEQVVLPFLRWAGVQHLLGLAITHDDSDHCGGVAAVRRGMAIERVIVPAPLPGMDPPLTRFHGRATRLGAVLHAAPPLVARWPPLDTAVFAPPPGITPDNAGGLVLECGTGRGRALLMADVDSSVEARLQVAGPIGVLKVGHHGSGSSSGATFLARVRPEIAVLSCGRRNRFGHPDPGAVARLRAVDAAIERTDVSGARWLELDDTGVRRVDWVTADPGHAAWAPFTSSIGAARPPTRP